MRFWILIFCLAVCFSSVFGAVVMTSNIDGYCDKVQWHVIDGKLEKRVEIDFTDFRIKSSQEYVSCEFRGDCNCMVCEINDVIGGYGRMSYQYEFYDGVKKITVFKVPASRFRDDLRIY